MPIRWVLAGVACCVACKETASRPEPERPTPREQSEEPAPAASPVATAAPEAPALAGEWMQPLESMGVVDFASPPLGAREPRPVVVALHGMDARPEWVCNDFRATFGPWPFLVCARGDVRSPANYSWGSTAGMRRAILRALSAAEARWPGYVRADDRVLVTYSQSATMAPALLVDPALPTFRAGFFLEGFTKHVGGYAPSMVAHGLSRAVFFATQPGNRAPAEMSAKALRRAGASAVASYGGSLGHWFTPKTVPALRTGVPPLVEGLPAWAAYPGPPRAE